MSLKETIAADITKYIKAKNTVARDALRMVLSDIKGQEMKAPIDDAGCCQIIKKMIKDNEEIIKAKPDHDGAEELRKRNEILQEYLPQTASIQQIKDSIAAVFDQIDAEQNAGKAKGIAFKHCKTQGLLVEAKDVEEAILALKSEKQG